MWASPRGAPNLRRTDTQRLAGRYFKDDGRTEGPAAWSSARTRSQAGREKRSVEVLKPAKSLGKLLFGESGFGQGSWRETLIYGIAVDSRRVKPGDLFAVLPGTRSHGANYLSEAVARGAVAILAPLGTALPPGLPGFLLPNVRAVLPRVASRLYDDPGRELRLTGVTGSNGKTTVVAMIAEILNRLGFRTAYWSTNEVSRGGGRFRPEYTTPESPDLQKFLREARQMGHRDAVIEVSSHAMVLNRIGGLTFAAGVVTNFSPDHLDFHRNLAEYRAAKRSFVAGLPPKSTVLLNADDSEVLAFKEAAAGRVWTFGLDAPADLGAEKVERGDKSLRFVLRLGPRVNRGALRYLPVELPMLGRHNIPNALAAIGVTLSYGLPAEMVVLALAGFTPPARRLETLSVGPYQVITDVAMNPGSYQAVLETVAALQKPLVVVNSLRGNRGPQVNSDTAAVLAHWDRRLHFGPVILTASQEELASLPLDYRVRPEERLAFLAEAERQSLGVSYHAELSSALDEGISRLPPGGVLLLLGTFGMDHGARLASSKLQALANTPEPGH